MTNGWFKFSETDVEDFEVPLIFHFGSTVMLWEIFLIEVVPLYNAFNVSGSDWEVPMVCWRVLPVFRAPWLTNNQLVRFVDAAY